jgi:hypothetical protein
MCEANTYRLKVTTLFESPGGDELSHQYYRNLIVHNLIKILPDDFFYQKETEELSKIHRQQILKDYIPIVLFSEVKQFPCKLSFFALSKYRSNSFKFFFEMISRWLTPGRKLNVSLVYSSDFRINDLGEEIFTFYDVVIHVETPLEFDEIQRNFPLIKEEIELGIHSEFYAQRILEIKGLSVDDKTALIQSFIAYLVKRFPKVFDIGLFTAMQHILIICRDDFKEARQARHLSRLISIQYLFRKELREAIKKKAGKRHLQLKFFQAFIRTPEGPKRVLCILVGVTFLRDQETFGEQHLLKAIQHYIPSAESVDHSFLVHKWGSENICLAYLEVKKKDGLEFTFAEIRKLRREMPANLKNRVEYRLHPIFMPRNEEEIMRNMVSLANQIRYLRDIPQIFVSFEEQAHSHLLFTVILARIVKQESPSIPALFKASNSFAEYVHDQTKTMGYLRKKYPKEATVFHLKLPKEGYLRADHSIDLYKARQSVVREISQVMGEVRDYNGGMISKQHELLAEICRQLQDVREYDELLLENFFYSLAPVVIRALVDPAAFKTLFLMLADGLEIYNQENYYLKFHTETYNQFALIISEDFNIQEIVAQILHDLHIPQAELAHAHVKAYGNMCIGYICCSQDPVKREAFFNRIELALKNWEESLSIKIR